MTKVVLFIATSLDGFIASPDGTVDWLFHDADYGYTEFMASIDAVVMGRKTWEQAKTFEAVPFAGKTVFVLARSNTSTADERIRFVQGEAPQILHQIRAEATKDIWLVGGGDVIQQFIAHDLIDEYRIFVHPVILGSGLPLFLPQAKMTTLSFVSNTPFQSGLIEMRYKRKA
ncbi:Dihydrofolate reductase [Anatilimnocola aggregata]|uniref:Dihydrofolate reductase n=1 Tax=Anatilimnocola aggregata TaxID=2528021 RepID=A0A517YH82_9BACT|nr:dihydrofolate reductase family protein [Anatilimnocola aggregata]QDU29562.1 Dihydrofolate reductase [Anatilimnocola aggregata]